MKIRLFIKPYCGWCHKAIHWLDQQGIKYETLDVIGDKEAYDEMVELSGQSLAPVIDVNGQVLAEMHGPAQEIGPAFEIVEHEVEHRPVVIETL